MYKFFFKRLLDILCASFALLLFSPLFIVLIISGTIAMKGNPFFTQERPGYKEKIFKLIKFRTMTNDRDENGDLMPDSCRLNGYGKFLRSTSLDELPEAINILIGDMSVIGPRPWKVKYLPYYSEREHNRHDVRPGLSGWAQVHGRNLASWEERLDMDLYYVENISFKLDVITVIYSVKAMFNRSNISLNILEDFDEYRKKQNSYTEN